MNKLVLALSTSLAVFALACGGSAPKASEPAGHQESEHEHGAVDAKDIKPNGEAKVGDKTKCPVSGEVFTVSESSPKYEYKGKTYYTCCSNCMKKVQENPDKYLGK